MKTSSISKNWKENIFLIACVCFFVLFVIIAAISGAWPGKDVSAQFFSAMAGALVAAIITLFLLKGQTAVEADRQKDSKVFEEKLSIYKEFLQKLCDVVKEQGVLPHVTDVSVPDLLAVLDSGNLPAYKGIKEKHAFLP